MTRMWLVGDINVASVRNGPSAIRKRKNVRANKICEQQGSISCSEEATTDFWCSAHCEGFLITGLYLRDDGNESSAVGKWEDVAFLLLLLEAVRTAPGLVTRGCTFAHLIQNAYDGLIHPKFLQRRNEIGEFGAFMDFPHLAWKRSGHALQKASPRPGAECEVH